MPKTYHIPLKSLQPMHMKIIELYLKCWKKKDIAAELGVSATTVSHTLRDPISQKFINAMMKESLHKKLFDFLPADVVRFSKMKGEKTKQKLEKSYGLNQKNLELTSQRLIVNVKWFL